MDLPEFDRSVCEPILNIFQKFGLNCEKSFTNKKLNDSNLYT